MSRPWHWTTTLPPSGRAMGTDRTNRIVSAEPLLGVEQGRPPPQRRAVPLGRVEAGARLLRPPTTDRTPEGRGAQVARREVRQVIRSASDR